MKQLCMGSAVLCAVLTTTFCFAHAQEAQSIGKAAYETYCAGCHGISGKGDGPHANSLTKPPADLTQIQNRNGGRFPSRELFDIIDGREEVAAHGTREMPVWAKIFKQQETEAPPLPRQRMFLHEGVPLPRQRMFLQEILEGPNFSNHHIHPDIAGETSDGRLPRLVVAEPERQRLRSR
jgi:hypothetical protein